MDNKINIPQGDSGEFILNVTYTSGIILDLTPFTDTKLSVKKTKQSKTYALQITGTITSPEAGLAEYAYTHDQTKELTPGNYVCDIRFWNPTTKAVKTILDVQFVIDWPVYDTLDLT